MLNTKPHDRTFRSGVIYRAMHCVMPITKALYQISAPSVAA
ncbi:hypothetical protein ACFQW4_11200 [Pantoea sp. GCM10028869]